MTEDREIETLLSAAADRALTPDERARLDAHLATHPADAARIAALRAQSALLQAGVPDPAPDRLDGLQRAARASAVQPIGGWRIAAAIALFAIGLGAGAWTQNKLSARHDPLDAFTLQAVAAHDLYVSEVLHPVEVGASQRGHLQTWLSNRLGGAIIAPELGDTGFHLIGGRLLPAGNLAAALFMYETEAGDRVSLVVTHNGDAAPQAFRHLRTPDADSVSWQTGNWRYVLVGDLPKPSMQTLAADIYGQLI